MPSTGSSLVWRESSRQTRLGRGGSLIGTGEVQAPIQVALLCEEQHNHLAVPRGKGGEGCQGSEKTEVAEEEKCFSVYLPEAPLALQVHREEY